MQAQTITAPSEDKRWRLVDATMRRHGNDADALIETLHTVQEAFGYLDEVALRYVAAQLGIPLSRVYGVATFYNYFTLKPEGEHACEVCLGTACYLRGGPQILETIEHKAHVRADDTTPDQKVSLLVARCVGTCGLAPVAVFDGEVKGNLTAAEAVQTIEKWMKS